MRLIITVGIMLLTIVAADAQKKKKPNINKAKSAWESGDLATAQSIIDDATTYEKTKDDGKTWYYRGLIYAAIDTTSNAASQALSDDAMNIALASFDKANEIDEEGKNYYTTGPSGLPILMNQQINGWYAYYFNAAVVDYEANDFESAMEKFLGASRIISTDTNSVANAGYSAANADMEEKSLELFEETMRRGAKSKNLILNVVRIHLENENLEKALEVVRTAKTIYPNDNLLNRQEVDILRKMGKLDEARTQLEVAIKNEPDNALLPFFLGILFEEDGDEEKAISAYDKATQVDPAYFDAYFNKAALLYNRGTKLQKEKNLLGYSKEDQKKAKTLEPKIKETFAAAIPIWEKLYELQPTDPDVLERLIYMYDLTNQSSKADKLEKELGALNLDE